MNTLKFCVNVSLKKGHFVMNNLLALFIFIVFIVYIIHMLYQDSLIMQDIGRFYEDSYMLIKIKYLRDIKDIEVFENGDWIDLRSGIDIELEAGEACIIPLGVAMELPKGYTGMIVPRSSTFKKWGILQTNSVGIIDESYCGDTDEWCLPVIAMRKTHIHKNDRICQFRLIKKDTEYVFKRVDKLGNKSRNGFGSTGEK